MAFALAARNSQIVDMNITPLVDVMLVLLIIFMVTMPLRTYGIGIDLAQPDRKIHPKLPPQPITLGIDAGGLVTWNGSQLPLSAVESAIKVEATRYADASDQPLIRIDADKDASYGTVADVLAAARNAGWVRIGFADATAR